MYFVISVSHKRGNSLEIRTLDLVPATIYCTYTYSILILYGTVHVNNALSLQSEVMKRTRI